MKIKRTIKLKTHGSPREIVADMADAIEAAQRRKLESLILPPDFFAFKHDLNETIAESLYVSSGGEQDA
jgi:hypothetical protein